MLTSEGNPRENDADKWLDDLEIHTHKLLYTELKPQYKKRQRVRVAILDSGLELERFPLKSRWERFKQFKGKEEWSDRSPRKHGTACASLLLQVAPESDLYIADVCAESHGNPDVKLVREALAWALSNEVAADIISMSLSFDEFDQEINDLISTANARGVLVFAAMSNEGDFDIAHGGFPAWVTTVFDIKSTTGIGTQSEGNPQLTGTKDNFMFLGEGVAVEAFAQPPLPLERVTGNSFATPIAAGAAALILDTVRLNAGLDEHHPRIAPALRTYDGMATVFRVMSGHLTPGRLYYNVRPFFTKWSEPPAPLALGEQLPKITNQWYALRCIAMCLSKEKKYYANIWGK